LTITYWPIEKIKPYDRNARAIPQKAVDKVAASLHEYDWQQPIVADSNGVIICGHVRWLARISHDRYSKKPPTLA
jgi:ParB-like chromosome segregation protein Spo0J